MSRENILKHLRCPDPTGQEDWEKRIEQAYHGTHSRWTENLHQSFLGFAIDAICDRCESLEQENARLRADRDRLHDFIRALRILIENGDTAHSFDHSALHLMLCDVLKPQEPSE